MKMRTSAMQCQNLPCDCIHFCMLVSVGRCLWKILIYKTLDLFQSATRLPYCLTAAQQNWKSSPFRRADVKLGQQAFKSS